MKLILIQLLTVVFSFAMKTYKVELIRPAGHSAMWVVRGLPDAFNTLNPSAPEPDWVIKWHNEIGVSYKNDTILYIDNSGDPAAYVDREILALHSAIYDEVNTNEAIKDGDVFEVEAADVPLWHDHDKDAHTFPFPAMKFKRDGFHAVPADEATDALLKKVYVSVEARKINANA